MSAVIEVRGVTRRFGDLLAVDSLDLSVDVGEVYGFLGRNGAGKTTLIRMLLGLIRPTQGAIRLLGRAVDSSGGLTGPWARVGYLLEGPGLYPELTVSDHLAVAAAYHRVPRQQVSDIVERLRLGGYSFVRAKKLSLGNRQRLRLATALVHRPDLLILDEATNGLDPAGVVEIRTLLRDLADSGATVFVSSHLISEVARVADRVGVIHEGRLIQEIPAAGLRTLGTARLHATLPTRSQVAAALGALEASGYTVTSEGLTLTLTDAQALAHPERVATVLVAAGAPPRALGVSQDDLEQHFLRLTGGRP